MNSLDFGVNGDECIPAAWRRTRNIEFTADHSPRSSTPLIVSVQIGRTGACM